MCGIKIISSYLLLLFYLGTLNCFGQKTMIDYQKLAKKQFNVGNYADAIINNTEALKLAEKNKNCKGIVSSNLQIGNCNFCLGNTKIALSYYLISKYYCDSCGVDSLSGVTHSNIGAAYLTLGNVDTALVYFYKTVSVLKNTKLYVDKARVYSLIGGIFLNKNGAMNTDLAKSNFDLAEQNAGLSKNYGIKYFVLLRFTNYYTKTGNLPLAKKYAQQAYDLVFANDGMVEEKIYVTRVLAQQLATTVNPKINQLYDQFVTLHDSVFKTESANKIADYKVQYETEKKITENKLLKQELSLNQIKINSRNTTIIGLLIGVLLIIVLFFWRLSVVNLKKKNKELQISQAIQKEKERISRDLHDNVGGQLSYILYSLDGINDEDSKKRTELTHEINGAVKNVVSNLRETIWAINDAEITVTDFADKLKVYTRMLFKNTPTKIIFNEQLQGNATLNSSIGLNLYRICQEVLTNAFKHAKASQLVVSITTVNNATTINISDNGVGFDNIAHNNNNSYGLTNMHARANDVNIKLNLKTEIDNGTTYTLVV